MVEKIIVIALLVMFVYASMEKGMIFEKVRVWLHRLPINGKKVVFDCPICMSIWYGTLFYWCIFGNNFRSDWREWIVVVAGAAGFNTVIYLISTRDF